LLQLLSKISEILFLCLSSVLGEFVCFLCVVWCGWVVAGCCGCVLVVEEGFETELQNGLDIVLGKLVASKFWSNFGVS
jgi:hypothetical protein